MRRCMQAATISAVCVGVWCVLAAPAAGAAGIEVLPSADSLPEGGYAYLYVRLTEQPAADVNVTAVWYSGDGDVRVYSGSPLTFTPLNWHAWQTVTLWGVDDGDEINGQATLVLTGTGLSAHYVLITELDDDFGDDGHSRVFVSCFVASAAYGSSLADEVEHLKSLRDAHLMQCAAGRLFVRGYYVCGPRAAGYVSSHERARAWVRLALRAALRLAPASTAR